MSKYIKNYKTLKLPIKVGQTVYCIQCDKDNDGYFTGTKSITDAYVTRIEIVFFTENYYELQFQISKRINTSSGYITTDKFSSNVIGDLIFYTKEDAKSHLRRIR